jgi:hypothetical protein
VSGRSSASIRSNASFNSSPPNSPVPSISSPASFASFPGFYNAPPLTTVVETPIQRTPSPVWNVPQVYVADNIKTQTAIIAPTPSVQTAGVARVNAAQAIATQHTRTSSQSTKVSQLSDRVEASRAQVTATQTFTTQATTAKVTPTSARRNSTSPVSTNAFNPSSNSSQSNATAPMRTQSTIPQNNRSSSQSSKSAPAPAPAQTQKKNQSESVAGQSVAAAAKRQSSASIPTFDRALTHVVSAPTQNTTPLFAHSGKSGGQKLAKTQSSTGNSKVTKKNIVAGLSWYIYSLFN